VLTISEGSVSVIDESIAISCMGTTATNYSFLHTLHSIFEIGLLSTHGKLFRESNVYHSTHRVITGTEKLNRDVDA
jgi:hypothetical protein